MDKRGWMAIHFAAFYGQVACIRALCRKDPTLLEMKTCAEYVIHFSKRFFQKLGVGKIFFMFLKEVSFMLTRLIY